MYLNTFEFWEKVFVLHFKYLPKVFVLYLKTFKVFDPSPANKRYMSMDFIFGNFVVVLYLLVIHL